MASRRDLEEKLLEDLITLLTAIKNTDGIKKIQDAITAVVSGSDLLNANQFTGTWSPAGAGNTTLIVAVENQTIKVYDFYLWNSGSADVIARLYFGTSSKSLFKGKLSAKTGVIKTFGLHAWKSNTNDSLILSADVAATIDYGVGAVQS